MKYRILLIALMMVGLLALSAFGKPLPKNEFGEPDNSFAPGPSTYDQITHSVGNIITTIDNFGYIGGYSYYGLPSGEWPRNSGHSYIAEIRYWMGGINTNGDTLVANTSDDFQAFTIPNNGVDDYKIYLSTDTSRYYDYDPTDTLGTGIGAPANGWRVWDNSSQTWEYNQVYNSLAAGFIPGGPTSLEDSYYRFGDDAEGSALMGLELSHQVLEWNYCYNEDFMYVIMDITNNSSEDYVEFAFGLYVDLDVGGEDGLGENGRLEDAVVYDTTEGWAFIYDVHGFDRGWNDETGVMGTKILETPNDIGMTAFRTDDWAYLPEDDAGRYAMINSQQFDTPLAPTDQFYIQSVRGINLTAGSTVRIVYAIVAGEDSADFVDNATRAQELYSAQYVGPEPPQTPTLTARSADGKIYLSWDNVAEESIDPLSKEVDFAGYKLYRSDNQGITWGKVNYKIDNSCMDFDYKTLANYRIINQGDPIVHSFIDTGLYNEVDYWYCLAAYDKGDTIIGVDPLQSGFGLASVASNVVEVRPQSNPAGYFNSGSTVEHLYNGNDLPSEGEIFPMVFDDDLVAGNEYEVHFEEMPEATYWHVLNSTTGDTIIYDQTITNSDEGLYEVAEGIRVVLNNGDRHPRAYGQVNYAGVDTTLHMGDFYGPGLNAIFGVESMVYGDQHFRSTYEFRYTGDSTLASWVLDGYYGTNYPYWVPFEVWNISTNQRVSLAVYDFNINDLWDTYDLLQVVNYPYDSTQLVTADAYPHYYSWMFAFDDTLYNPAIGDVFSIEGAPMNGPGDVFAFKVDGVDNSAASNALSNIKVVPNPYFVQYSSLVENDEGESVLIFDNLPDQCTIRIYTLAGELIQSIVHNDDSGSDRWNLLSENNLQVSSGIYLYHVESPYGEHMGRFSVIK